MKKVIATQNERLDEIVHREYKRLQDVFEKVLDANKHLTGKVTLDLGDIVYLPVITLVKTQTKDDELW